MEASPSAREAGAWPEPLRVPLRVDVLDLIHRGQPSTNQATDVDAGTALLR